MVKFVRIASFLIAAVITVFSVFLVNGDRELAQAQAAYRSGDMDQALRKARRANNTFSETNKKVSAYYIQSRAAAKMNWTKKANDYLNELLQLDPENISGLLFRGEIALQLENNQQALQDLDKGIALASGKIKDKDLAYSISKRGLAFLALNRINEAEADAQTTLQLAPDLPEAHDLMSRIYEKSGNIKMALVECEKTYELSIKIDRLSFMTPEGEKLSKRLVDLRVKNIQNR